MLITEICVVPIKSFEVKHFPHIGFKQDHTCAWRERAGRVLMAKRIYCQPSVRMRAMTAEPVSEECTRSGEICSVHR